MDDVSGDDLAPITTIHLDCTDKRGKTYRGVFTYKVPSLGDQIRIGALKASRLPVGAGGDAMAFLMSEQISYLEVTLQDPLPKWWKPMELYDPLPVMRLYDEVISYANRFLGIGSKTGANQGTHSDEKTEQPETESVANAHGARSGFSPAPKRQTVVSTD